MAIIRRWVSHALCWLSEGGHEWALKHEPTLMCLRCQWCGRQTPGWQLAPITRTK